MQTAIRKCRQADAGPVGERAIRAWAPVFASLEEVLGPEMFRRLHGDSWEDFQRAAVRGGLADPQMRAWGAEAGAALAGGGHRRRADRVRYGVAAGAGHAGGHGRDRG